jgi:hypothetical protein
MLPPYVSSLTAINAAAALDTLYGSTYLFTIKTNPACTHLSILQSLILNVSRLDRTTHDQDLRYGW